MSCWPRLACSTAPTPEPGRHVPIRALHGAADAVVDVAGARSLHARLRQLGYDATLEEFAGIEHSISPEMQNRINALLRERL